MGQTRILIVEDQNLIALSLKNKLQDLGYFVPKTLNSGEKAVLEVAIDKPDLVLMDIKLAGEMDGITAGGLIREEADIPIIYLTAYSNDEFLQRAKVTEPFGYLIKPIDNRELQTAIQMSLYKHQMERQLKEREAFFRVMFEMAPIGMVIASIDGRFQRVNQAYCDTVGYSAEQLIGRHFADISHPDDLEPNMVLNRQLLAGEITGFQMEKRYIHKDGHAVHVMLHATLLHDDKGKQQNLIGQVVDITERVKVEQERERFAESNLQLLAAEKKARQVAEIVQGANISLTKTLDLDSVLATLLDYLADYIPYDSAVVLLVDEESQLQVRMVRDQQPLRVAQKKNQVQSTPLVQELLANQASILVENIELHPKWVHRESSAHVKSWLGVPLRAVNKSIGLYSLTSRKPYAFTKDHLQLTEALAAQAAIAIQNAQLFEDLQAQIETVQQTQKLLIQSEKMTALGRLIASLAHEINNPIQAMQGCLILGLENFEKGDMKRAKYYLHIVQSEIDRVAGIIKNLRDFYRLPIEKMLPTDLETVLDDVLQLVKKQLQYQAIVVQREAKDSLPTLLAHANHLKQVFLNLIFNAVDAMPDGGISTYSNIINHLAKTRYLTICSSGENIVSKYR